MNKKIMNIRDLKYLVAISQYQHFGKAAKACHVSQPALSIQIKKLEEMLGVQLLERTNKSVRLTDIGRVLSTHARKILNQVNEFYEIAHFAKDSYSGELRLGIIPSSAPYLLPHILQKLSQQFPKLKIFLIEWPTEGLIQKLEQGNIDAAILPLPIDQQNLMISSLYEEDFLLAVPNHHALSAKRTIKKSELKNEKLLLLEDGHCMSESLKIFCKQVKATLATDLRATSIETLRHMVTIGMGLTLIPKLACNLKDNFSYVTFEKPKPSRLIGMVSRTTSPKKLLLDEIVCCIKKLLGKDKIVKVID